MGTSVAVLRGTMRQNPAIEQTLRELRRYAQASMYEMRLTDSTVVIIDWSRFGRTLAHHQLRAATEKWWDRLGDEMTIHLLTRVSKTRPETH